MAQAEFIEVLERLASGWKVGIQLPPSSVMRTGSVANRLAIEAPPASPSNSLFEVLSSFSLGDTVDSFSIPFASTSSAPKTTLASSLNHVPGRDGPSASAIKQARVDLVEALDCARILLVPVAARHKERACQAAADKANKKKPLNINIPLYGPRVEIILVWLAAVHVVEFESVA